MLPLQGAREGGEPPSGCSVGTRPVYAGAGQGVRGAQEAQGRVAGRRQLAQKSGRSFFSFL